MTKTTVQGEFQPLLDAYCNGWGNFWRNPMLFMVLIATADIPLSLIKIQTEKVENNVLQFLLGLPLVSVVTPFAKVAVVTAFGAIQRNQPIGFIAAYQPVLRRILPLIAAVILWSLAAFLGVAALVVGAIIVLIGGQFIAAAVVLEKLNPIAAAQRSWHLVKPVFALIFILFVSIEVGAALVSTLLETVLGLLPIGVFAPLISSWLSAPIVYMPLAAMYHARVKVAPLNTAVNTN